MKLVGMMACRNEAWCLGLTLRAALQWCDEMVVLLHACTDASEVICMNAMLEAPNRIWTLHAPLTQWDEMQHRQRMFDYAREQRGATHLAIVDADELVTGNLLVSHSRPFQSIHSLIDKMPKGSCLQLPLYNLRGSLDRYHSNGIWGCDRWLSVAFQDDPNLSWSGDNFHSREPLLPRGGRLRPYQPIKHGQGGSFHLWGVSERRLRAKQALYKITERLKWPGKSVHEINNLYNLWRTPHDSTVMYPQMREWGKEWTFASVPLEWWEPYEPLMRHLHIHGGDYDSRVFVEPWQEVEVRRLVAQHGAEIFKGLDLFGCDTVISNAPMDSSASQTPLSPSLDSKA